MLDITLEILSATAIAFLIVMVIRNAQTRDLPHTGWRFILAGLALILFGSIIDILDNFESLNKFVFIGNTATQAILEKVLGSTVGFALVCVGIMKWIPTLSSMDRVVDAYNKLAHSEVVLKSTYTKLEKKQAELFSILQNTPDIIYRLDKDGMITFISDAIKMYGHEPEDLIGIDIINLIHPDDRESVKYQVKEKRTGERSTKRLELRFLTAHNSEIEAEIHTIDLERSFVLNAEGIYTSEQPDGHYFVETQGVARDITERKNMEREVGELKEILPICANCKNIRDDDGYWQRVELYFKKHTDILFSHSICPDCSTKLYPNLFDESKNDTNSDDSKS